MARVWHRSTPQTALQSSFSSPRVKTDGATVGASRVRSTCVTTHCMALARQLASASLRFANGRHTSNVQGVKGGIGGGGEGGVDGGSLQ